MDLSQSVFAYSPSIRASLKRGLARAAFAQAGCHDPDIGRIVETTRQMHPNRKAQDRSKARLSRIPGVVKASLAADGSGLVLVLRNLREVVTQADSADLFSETALFYTRLFIQPGRHGTGFRLQRVSFCLHALERLVERSDLPLDRPLLPHVDAEATSLLRRLWLGKAIEDNADHYFVALQQGVWAGSLDRSALEPDWKLAFDTADAGLPVYSVRTFLSPDEMRPTVWLKWKDDPTCRIAG